MAVKKKKLPKDVSIISVEKITNGYVVKFPEYISNTPKVFRATLNGVLEVMSETWKTPIIKLDNSKKTTTRVGKKCNKK